MSPSLSGLTAQVAGEVAGMSYDDLTPSQRARAKHVMLDWLAVTYGGCGEESSRIVQRLAVQDQSAPVASIVGTTVRTSVGHAALANGVAARALDFDDTSWWTGGHPGAAVVAATIALAESLPVGGREVAEALVAGLQGQARIYLGGGGPVMFAKGFDGTGVFSAFGAAGACGRLLGLDADAMDVAFGLAATQAAGLAIHKGTMANHLNSGRAAATGVLAAQLAAEGFTAAAGGIEDGFAPAFAGTFDPALPERTMGQRLTIETMAFKRHACAGGTHAAIDGIMALRSEQAFAAEQVQEVRLITSPDMGTMCGVAEPKTGLDAKFSMRFGAALAVAEHTTGPEAFTDETVHDAALDAVRRRVAMIVDEDRQLGTMRIEVDLVDGTRLATESGPVLSPVGDDALDDEWAALVAKLDTLASPIAGDAATAKLVAAVDALEDLDLFRNLFEQARVT